MDMKEENPYLMQQKAHQPRRNDWVPNENIPINPLLLEPVERTEIGVGINISQGVSRGRYVERHGSGGEREWVDPTSSCPWVNSTILKTAPLLNILHIKYDRATSTWIGYDFPFLGAALQLCSCTSSSLSI